MAVWRPVLDLSRIGEFQPSLLAHALVEQSASWKNRDVPPQSDKSPAALKISASPPSGDGRRQNDPAPGRAGKWQLFGNELGGGLQIIWAERRAAGNKAGRRNPGTANGKE